MQKVLALLEKHVQWAVLGLGGLLLVFMLARFLPGIANPVPAEINGRSVSAGEIDEIIRNESTIPLREKLDSTRSVEFKVPDYVSDFRKRMQPPTDVALLPGVLFPVNPTRVDGSSASTNIDLTGGTLVATIPTLPAPINDTVAFGQARVSTFTPSTAPVREANAPAPADARDVTWVRVQFKLNLAAVAQSFQVAGIPPQLQRTSALRVELVRQRQLPDGTWGEETVVQPLPHQRAPGTWPAQRVAPAGIPASDALIAWAIPRQLDILQPEFFEILVGDDPTLVDPTRNRETSPAIDPATFDPSTYTGPLADLPPELRRLVVEYRRQRAAEEAERRRGERGGRGGGRGGRGGGEGGPPAGFSNPPTLPQHNGQTIIPADAFNPGSYGSASPSVWTHASPDASHGQASTQTQLSVQASATPFQNAPRGPIYPPPGMPGAGRSEFPPGVWPPGEFPGEFFPGEGMQPQLPNDPQRLQFPPPPTAPFNPAEYPGGEVVCWAYDDSALPDQTYRYRVRYFIQNPLYKTQNVAKNAEDAQVVWIAGENDSGFSAPVKTPPLVHVFLAANPAEGQSSARLAVFRWQNGLRHKDVAVYNIGEPIGRLVGEIDYRSSWTLVDIRSSPLNTSRLYVVLMSPDGRLIERYFDTDRNDALFLKLDAEAASPR
jgi:hypothetical protein